MEEEYKNIREIVINNPIYKYSGNVGNQEIKSILEDLEKLTENIGSSRFKKRSYHVLVELLRNSEVHNVNNTEIKFFLKIFEGKLFFMCENETDIANVSALTKQINKLNALSREELKDYYKSILINWDGSTKPLNLINIARSTNNKILYNFTKINDKSTLVSLITTIDIK